MTRENILVAGATGSGKSKATVRDALSWKGPVIVLDWHFHSTGFDVLSHAPTNRLLYDNLSDTEQGLNWEFFPRSNHPHRDRRAMENDRNAELFKDLLLRRRGDQSLAHSPLLDEWFGGLSQLWVAQENTLPLTVLPFAFQPGSREFDALITGCTNRAVQWKFEQLRNLTPRALRAEVGAAARLIQGTFGSPSIAARSSGRPFDFAAFMQSSGILVIERGEILSADAAGTMMGAIILRTIDYAKRRPHPHPPILLVLEEANNAGLIGKHESQALAETRKYGLFFRIVVQSPTFPREIEENVFQNTGRHEYFRCGSYEIARRAAQDIAAGMRHLAYSEISRAEQIAQLTTDLLNMAPGWRHVRNHSGSFREYVPLLGTPWTFPSLQTQKLREKLALIYAKPQYAGRTEINRSLPLSTSTPRPPSNLRAPSSPAARLRQRERRPTGDSIDFAESD
jgi:hypothetical protein